MKSSIDKTKQDIANDEKSREFDLESAFVDYKPSTKLLFESSGIRTDKDLPNDYESSSLEELTLEANKIIEDLESQKDLQNSIEKYQNLIKLNNIIEKKFKKKVTDINTTTKDNISKITSKNNAKKTK